MDVSEYRKRLQDELDESARDARRTRQLLQIPRPPHVDSQGAFAAADQHDESSVAESVRIALDPSADPERRVMALNLMVVELSKRHDLIDLVIALLADRSAAVLVRREALAVLRAASFRVATFAPMRAHFLDALRSIVEDPDLELRNVALEVLAQEKDEYVQRRLVEGLQNEAVALVPPERAIELLGYDIHAGHYPLLRAFARGATSSIVKQQAIRLLGADAASRDLLEEVLTDRKQDSAVRAASAAALQALVPEDFQRLAARIVLDDGEDEQLRAASVSALDHFATPGAAVEDPDLVERMRQLQSIGSGELQRAARRFLNKREK